MNAKITFILSLSCCLPLIAYLFNYKRVDKMFHPLIAYLFIVVIAETLVGINSNYLHIKKFMYYVYVPAMIFYVYFFCQFYFNTGILKNQNYVYWITALFAVYALFNYLVFYPKEKSLNMFKVGLGYAAIVLFLSVELFIKQVFGKTQRIFSSPLFLISLAGIIFHSFFIFIVSLMLLKTDDGKFMNLIFNIQKVINVLYYTIYTVAILWIPKAKSYIKQYS